MYRKKSDHRIVVEKVGEGFIRLGAKLKFPSISYRDREGKIDSRPTTEFQTDFEPVK